MILEQSIALAESVNGQILIPKGLLDEVNFACSLCSILLFIFISKNFYFHLILGCKSC